MNIDNEEQEEQEEKKEEQKEKKKRVVIKVGSNVLSNTNNRIVLPVLRDLIRQMYLVKEAGFDVILVSSGAAIAGKEIIGNIDEKSPSIRRQIFSSVGQPRMMRHYYSIFSEYGLDCAQVLATKRDFSEGKHKENMINCCEGLLRHGIIPIANEDDAVSLSMSMFTDNDELAGLVAHLVNADLMIILTDIDGVYTGDPNLDSSELLSEIHLEDSVDKYLQDLNKKEGEGRGGMKSKVKIAKEAVENGVTTIIANGKRENVIVDIVLNEEKIGTEFRK